MKKVLLTSIVSVAITTFTLTAQEVISTQGDSYSNSSGSIDFTIGEVIISTGTDGTNDITQGFHQTNWNFVDVITHEPSYEASIYPNPTEELLYIRTSNFENVRYALYDAQGRLVDQGALLDIVTPIRVHRLAPGAYSITLNNHEQKLKTFMLIRSH